MDSLLSLISWPEKAEEKNVKFRLFADGIWGKNFFHWDFCAVALAWHFVKGLTAKMPKLRMERSYRYIAADEFENIRGNWKEAKNALTRSTAKVKREGIVKNLPSMKSIFRAFVKNFFFSFLPLFRGFTFAKWTFCNLDGGNGNYSCIFPISSLPELYFWKLISALHFRTFLTAETRG